MSLLRKGAVVSLAAAAAALSGGFQEIHRHNISECDSNSGYVVSTQDMRTDSVVGTYDIREMHAISLIEERGMLKNIRDRGSVGDASMQLNAYIDGSVRGNKPKIYWVQDTVHFIGSAGSTKQYLSSEVFRISNNRNFILNLSHVNGKGRVYTEEDNQSGEKTYIYDAQSAAAVIPQKGYLEMSEKLMRGRIMVSIGYNNGKRDNVEVYDTIKIGRKGEFSSAYFFSNNVFDIEMGFGGDNSGALGYFSNTAVYAGLYYNKENGYVKMRYDPYSRISTTEHAIGLSCRYYAMGYEQFYAYRD